MLTDVLRDLDVVAIHGHKNLILEINTCNTYMSIQPHKMMISSVSIDAWYIKYFYVLQAIECMILKSDILQRLNPTTKSLGDEVLELWNYTQSNFLVTLLHWMAL